MDNNGHKTKRVNDVFNQVYNKYDLMNDIMSLGVHRIWKNNFVTWLNPQPHTKLIDVASGTGDITRYIYQNKFSNVEISCVDPNKKMYQMGKIKLADMKNVNRYLNYAENLPFKTEEFDYYTISFGLRNTTNIHQSLKEAHRVLKKGGRFMCLEFSKVENEIFKSLYNSYSKIIPKIGKIVTGNEKPYDYLINSIDSFYNQEQLLKLIAKNGFENLEYRNLSNGISAIHSGWKI